MTIGSNYFRSYARNISFAIATANFAARNDPAVSDASGDRRALAPIARSRSKLELESGTHSSSVTNAQDVI